MIVNALQFLLETAFNLFVLTVLLRFFMQVFRAPVRNPLAQFVNAFTDFAVLPARKFIPGWKGYDMASLFVAWLAECILQGLVLALRDFPSLTAGFPVIALLALVYLLKWSVYLLICVVFVQAIMSWLSPYHPMAPLLNSLTRPFLDPIRKRLPLVGNVDLSPLVVFVVCQLLLMLPVRWLELQALGILSGPLVK